MSFTWLRHFCDNKTENENLFFRIVDLNKIRLFAIETSKSIHSSTNSYTSITCESHYKSWAFTILTHLCIVSKNLYYTGLFLCIVTFLFNEIVEVHGRYKKIRAEYNRGTMFQTILSMQAIDIQGFETISLVVDFPAYSIRRTSLTCGRCVKGKLNVFSRIYIAKGFFCVDNPIR